MLYYFKKAETNLDSGYVLLQVLGSCCKILQRAEYVEWALKLVVDLATSNINRLKELGITVIRWRPSVPARSSDCTCLFNSESVNCTLNNY